MKPGWFERRGSGAPDVQFKAQLLSAIPEESDEISFTVDSASAPS